MQARQALSLWIVRTLPTNLRTLPTQNRTLPTKSRTLPTRQICNQLKIKRNTAYFFSKSFKTYLKL